MSARQNETTFDPYRLAWDHGADPLLVVDGEGVVLAANPSLTAFYGRPEGEVVGKDIGFLFPLDERERVQACYRELFQGPANPPPREITLRRADGADRVMEARISFQEEGDERVALIAALRDISVRKQAEARLLGIQEQFRASVENMLDSFGIYSAIRDEHGRIVDFRVEYVNESASRNNDMPREDQIGRTLLEVLPAHGDQGLIDAYARVVETGEPLIEESLEYRDMYGQEWRSRIFSLRVTKLGDGFIASWRDITSHKRGERHQQLLIDASKMLAHSFDYQQALREVARLVVPEFADWCMIDLVERDGAIRLLDVTHRDPEQVERVRYLRQQHPLTLETTTGVPQVIRSGEPQIVGMTDAQGETSVSHNGGDPVIWHEIGQRAAIIVPLITRHSTIGALTFARSENTHPYTVNDVALAEDLARRTVVAIEHSLLYQEVQEALRERDAFLSIAAHELRNPLTVIIGQSQLLKRRMSISHQVTDRDQRTINIIAEQAARVNAMIGSMLDVSRLEQGQLEIERLPLDLNALAQRVVEAIQPSLAQHSLHLTLPDEPLYVSGDSLRLEQVLQNLIGNAIKYSPNGGHVEVTVERNGERASITVRDEGIGIPVASQAKLFRRFYRAENGEAQRISGSGVGLYVVREVVALHGGEVTVESVENQGSAFTIRLPLLTETNGAA